MKTKKYSAVLGLAALLGATCLTAVPALAGGLYGAPVGGMKDSVVVEDGMAIPAPVPMEETATWYVRGDIGFGWHGSTSGERETVGYESVTIQNFDIDSQLSLSLGAGYYFTQNFRGDLTYDYRTTAQTNGYQILGNTDEGPDVKSSALLANLYYDFSPSSTISPYLGGGIGMAFNDVEMNNSARSYSYKNNAGEEVLVTQTARESGTTRFSAMATAGVNIALRENLFLDIGYRYAYLGQGKLVYDRVELNAAAVNPDDRTKRTTNTLSMEHMDVHELKIGLRYDLY